MTEEEEEEEEEVKKASTQRRVLESPSGQREETTPDLSPSVHNVRA